MERITVKREVLSKDGKWREAEHAEFKGNNAQDQLVIYIIKKWC